MDCKEFQARLDLYVDGELAAESAAEARAHLKGCASCAKAEAGLRHLRSSLKRVVNRHGPPPGLEREVLRSVRSSARSTRAAAGKTDEGRRAVTHVWRAKVVVPLPFLALLVLSVFALAGWSVFSRGPARGPGSIRRPEPVASTPPGGFDLSRYYGGGRASIQVVRRAGRDGSGR